MPSNNVYSNRPLWAKKVMKIINHMVLYYNVYMYNAVILYSR